MSTLPKAYVRVAKQITDTGERTCLRWNWNPA